MTPDPKWLELLKASGWQTLAIALACAGILFLGKWHIIPALAPWVVQLAAFGGLVCALLTIASLILAVNRLFPFHAWLTHWIKNARERRACRDYIPHMTPHERKIIAYLLAHNQKMFTAASDGGYAATLVSRGIIVRALRPGQIFRQDDMPMAVPDHLWKVLVKYRSEFPIPDKDQKGPYPWRVPWNLQ